MSVLNPTKADVVRFAEAKARADRELQHLGMVNVAGISSEQRVSIDAEFQIAKDIRDRAHRDYSEAFRKWANAGYPESPTPSIQADE